MRIREEAWMEKETGIIEREKEIENKQTGFYE
jgi:hypothetical protein